VVYLRLVGVATTGVDELTGWRFALATMRAPANLRRTTRIALVVGTVLTLINQGDVLVGGDATALTAFKIALCFVVPFVVSNLGVISGARNARL
jgi:hypothetical protein